jgi:uridylate kinase
MKEKLVISLGGSLICPEDVDFEFIKKFKNLILKQKKKWFIICCGGGKVARKYQKTARFFSKNNKDLDWLGIFATYLNAQIVKIAFGKRAFKKILSRPQKIKSKKIVIASGWKPGFSTDLDSVLWAKENNIKSILNLTNIDFIYEKDPRKFKNAKPIFEISWKDYRKLISKKFKPGMNVPFDPIASKLAQRLKLKTFFLNGRNFSNLEKFLKGEKFKGTIIY